MARCTALSKQSGERCKRHASKGRTNCANHGGKAPSGLESGTFKHGRYSKYLPDRLAEKYHEAINDENMAALDDEIGLIDTRLRDLLGRLTMHGDGVAAWGDANAAYRDLRRGMAAEDGGLMQRALMRLETALQSGDEEWRAWRAIVEMIEERRRLVDTERRRLLDEDQIITVERLMIFVAAIADIVKRNVASREERAAVSNEVRLLVSGSNGAS